MDAATVGLFTGSIGVIGTLAGVGFTQWRSDVRERSRIEVEERREQTRLDRETDREQSARLFDHRRTAYSAVIREYHHWMEAADRPGPWRSPEDGVMGDFWQLLSEIDLYGSRVAATLARDLYFAISDVYYDSKDPMKAHDRFNEFLDAARTDLGVTSPKAPPGSSPGVTEP